MVSNKTKNRSSRYSSFFCRMMLYILWFTFPAQAEMIRFAVVSDTQGDPVNSYTYPLGIDYVLDMSQRVDFVIVAGDLVWGVD